MISNEKSLNYKVVYLVESSKFCIKFIFIQVHKKSYDFLKINPNRHGQHRLQVLQ
jgi:hypothetical protein